MRAVGRTAGLAVGADFLAPSPLTAFYRLLPPSTAQLLLLAGRIAARPGAGPEEQRTAATLFGEVVRTGGGGAEGTGAAAPAAELEWARLLLRQLQALEAVRHLEHLILSYPESAVVPEARRELERAKGAIPKS